MINPIRVCLLLTTCFFISPWLFGAQRVYVSPHGSDATGDGSDGAPFASPRRALQAIADSILQSGLPDGGFEVRLCEGEHFIASPLVFDSSILGQESRPIVMTSEPGKTARLTGGVRIDPGQWAPIIESDRLYNTLPAGSRGQVLVADLPAAGITDFGTLAVRGFEDSTINAMELFVDGNPMQLARWPNPEQETTGAADPPQVILTGSPAVAGTYNQTGTADGKPYYTRDGLVNGLQYYLYRQTWFWDERWLTAWFLTANESGYPSSTHPFWSRYTTELGDMNPANQSGATGALLLGDSSGEVVLTGSSAVAGTYNQAGTADGQPYYRRDGLVNGLQYNLYRSTWFSDEHWHTAWFLTANESGYPSSTHPFWSRYTTELGDMNPASQSGATGTVLLEYSSEEKLRAGLAYTLNGVADTTFKYRGSRPAAWTGAGAEDIWLHGFWKHTWADFHIPMASIDPEQKTITLAQAPHYGMGNDRPFYALNLIHELDQPGEYYLDRTSGKLYLWPPLKTHMQDAVIQVSISDDYLVKATSTAGHVVFRSLVFECARQNLMILEGSSCRVESSILRNCGKTAIVIRGQNNQVVGSHITQTGSSGIEIDSGNRSLLTLGSTSVENCAINNFGRLSWTYKPGVHLRGVGNTVRHCHLWDAPHTAVLYAGNEHRIELNEIHDVCRYSSDARHLHRPRLGQPGQRNCPQLYPFHKHAYRRLWGPRHLLG